MKNTLFTKFIMAIGLNFFLVSCSEPEIYNYKGFIENRDSVDPCPNDCEACFAILEPEVCCCRVELLPIQLSPIDLHICGVLSAACFNEGCSMSTGNGPCYTFGNRGMQATLDPFGQTVQYFCIERGEAFSLFNGNGSGVGWVSVDCTKNGTWGGSIGIGLSYPLGSYVSYFQSDGNCDLVQCDN